MPHHHCRRFGDVVFAVNDASIKNVQNEFRIIGEISKNVADYGLMVRLALWKDVLGDERCSDDADMFAVRRNGPIQLLPNLVGFGTVWNHVPILLRSNELRSNYVSEEWS